MTSRAFRDILKIQNKTVRFRQCIGGKTVENNMTPQNESQLYYSQMLLRQHPWLKGQLKGTEYPVAISYRKPENLFGTALVFIGGFTAVDALLHVEAFGGIWPVLALILAGILMVYGGAWVLCFAKRSYVLVTSERIVYQKTDLLGRPGKVISVPRSEIQGARFLKSTVMFRAARNDGGISIAMKDGKTILISSLKEAENILGALR